MSDNLPPLPTPARITAVQFCDDGLWFNADQMQAYARAALAEAAQSLPDGVDIEDLKDRLVAISSAVADDDDRAAQAILRTTLELLAASPQPQPVQPSEQAAFEDWLYRVCPSGDVTEVQRQWEASSDFANWLESQRTEDVLIDGAVYTVPTEVACELLRLHMELQAAQPTGAVLNTELSGR